MLLNNLRLHLACIVRPLTLSFIFALLLVVPESAAQQANVPVGPESPGAVENRRNEFGIWGGISFDAPTWIGKTPEARFGSIGLRYGRVLAANEVLLSHGPSTPFRSRFSQPTARLRFNGAESTRTAQVCHQ